MATQIRPNRLVADDRFPMLGFTVRTDGSAKRYEIAIGTSPDLFGPEGKSHRNRHNFYSTRSSGPLPMERGEAVYVLPSEVLARFIGQQKLYYGLATFTNGMGSAQVASMPKDGSPYINVAGLTGRSLQRVRLLPNRQRAAANYGKNGSEMEWAGDAATPGMQPATPSAGMVPSVNASPAPNQAPAHYDDGYGPLPPPAPAAAPNPLQPQAKSLADDANDESVYSIPGPIPDGNGAAAQSLARSMGAGPDYPQASRFVQAVDYKAVSGTRTVNRIVIHITDGHPQIDGIISWFQTRNKLNKLKKPMWSSAHYIVGQDGEVVQMVRNNDIAWHASAANNDSIGIEHVARSPHEWNKKDPGLQPTESQYCASASLVNWLCNQLNIPMDRAHILGHNEVSPGDGHTDCPDGVWDWDFYMGLVTTGSCSTQGATASSLGVSRRMGMAKTKAMDAGLAFDENWNDVDVVGQPENYSCWATAAALVVGWRDRVSMDIQALKKLFSDKTGVASDRGLYLYDDQKLATAFGLVAEPPQSYTVAGFRQLLEGYGPLWVGIHTEDGWGHAVVATGIYGDGTPENTYVRIHDPWGRTPGAPGHPGYHNPTPGQGSRYSIPYSEFSSEYEAQASSTDGNVNVQILHAADTAGRTIGMGADQAYSLSAGTTQPIPANGARMHHHKHHRASHTAVVKATADDSGPQPVQLPQARLLTGWEKTVVRTAVNSLLEVAGGPIGAVLPTLVELVNKQGFSVGLALAGDAGLLGGAGLSFGIILAPDDNVGVFGSGSVSAGLLAGVSAGTRVILIHGGIEAFNDTGYSMTVTLEPEAGPSVSAIALFNSNRQFDGVSFQVGVAASLSPIQIFTSSEKSVSTPVTQSLASDDVDSDHDIDGPIPDGATSQSLARAMALTPEYPQASRFEPADSGNFRAVSGARTINRCVIHITDGGANINGTIGWFKNPAAKVSAHYVIGQDGEVVQMVKHNDVAWHAGGANGDSIGIEHVANTRGLVPTSAQYCASAALVNWLCNQFGISMDRVHVLGHSEADPKTSHKACPNAVWDWDYYMGMVTSGSCYEPQPVSESLSVHLPPPPRKRARSQALDGTPGRLVTGSPVTTVKGGDGNVTWELDQFAGTKTAQQAAPGQLQSAESIELSNWPYCEHSNGSRSCAWFTVDWRFSGKALGEIRITPSGAQQGALPLSVEARIEDSKDAPAGEVSLTVRFTYRFATHDGSAAVALTDLKLFGDGSVDQTSNWKERAAA